MDIPQKPQTPNPQTPNPKPKPQTPNPRNLDGYTLQSKLAIPTMYHGYGNGSLYLELLVLVHVITCMSNQGVIMRTCNQGVIMCIAFGV